jgi:glycosyltransferase involved in cell wall biosynthesis
LASRFDVRVVCGFTETSVDGVPDNELLNGVHVERVGRSMTGSASLAKRLTKGVALSTMLFRVALKRIAEGDGILVVTNPPMLPMLITIAARARRARLTLLVHDVYPQVLIAAGVTSQGSPMARAVQRMSDYVYRNAHRIIVLGRDMKQLIESRIDAAQRAKVLIIPNWGDIDDIQPMPRAHNPVLEKLGIDSAFVVQIMGTVGRTHALETLVDAAALLHDDASIQFLIIGDGARRAWLDSEIQRRGLRNVHTLGKVPWTGIAVHLAACDVSVIPYIKGMDGVSVPSRMYNVMASGRPIIAAAGDTSELARVVAEEKIGWVTPPGDGEALAEAIRAARGEPAELDEMGARARGAAVSKYSRDAVIQRYCGAFAAFTAD